MEYGYITPDLQALPKLPLLQDFVEREMSRIMILREAAVRRMLEQWVSECDPCIIMRQDKGDLLDRIVGLGLEGDPTGMIVIPIMPGVP